MKGQPIPHIDMHGCGYGMSDIDRCAHIHLGSHRKTNTIQKCHPNPSKHAIHSQYSIVSDTRTKRNEIKQIKLNKSTKRTKSEQHKQYQSAAVFNKEVCINTIRCFFWFIFLNCNLFLHQFCLQFSILVNIEVDEQGLCLFFGGGKVAN